MTLICTTPVGDLKEVDVFQYVQNSDKAVEIYDNVHYVNEMHKLLFVFELKFIQL